MSDWADEWTIEGDDPRKSFRVLRPRRKAVPSDIRSVEIAQGRWMDSFMDEFESELRQVVSTARLRTVAEMTRLLDRDSSGNLLATQANQEALAGLTGEFASQLDTAGLRALLAKFQDEFGGQLGFLDQVLQVLADQTGNVAPDLGASGLEALNGMAAQTVDYVRQTVNDAAAQTVQRVLFSLGGLPFEDFVTAFADRVDVSIGLAVTHMHTALASYYRVASASAFAAIESTQQAEVRYVYSGPDDNLTRPFCHEMLQQDPMTRDQIENLDNGQLPNPFLTGGGYNCRHTWIIDVDSLIEQRAA